MLEFLNNNLQHGQLRHGRICRALAPRAVCVFAAVLIIAMNVEHAAAQNTTDSLAPGQWVEQLGSPKFQEREQAARALFGLGMQAADALREGMQSDDAEIAARCRQILSDTLTRNFDDMRNKFQQDLHGADGHGLPGFETYAETIGNSPGARRLFSMMLHAAPDVMRCLDQPPEQIARVVDLHVEDLYTTFLPTGIDTSPGRFVALYYASALDGVACRHETFERFSYSGGTLFDELVADKELNESCRVVLNNWLEHNLKSISPDEAARLALAYELPSGLPLALRLMDDAVASPADRMYAILVVARLGNETQIKDLRKLFGEKVACLVSLYESRKELQIRDVALVAAIHLQGGDPKDFGFINREVSERTIYVPSSLSFERESDRQAALEAYRHRFEARKDKG